VAGRLILLMPVRVTQAKNIEFALEVMVALKARIDRPRLVLTGPPDPHDQASMVYFRSLQARRQQLGVEEELRFVFESGPEPGQPYLIDAPVVGELFRVADLMFMPSHREGFAMPVLEAGLAGIPVVATAVPAAQEIAAPDAIVFDLADGAAGGRPHPGLGRQRPGASLAPPHPPVLHLAGHLPARHPATPDTWYLTPAPPP
jgi:mannosylglucosylglycerate synthase